MNNTTGLFIAEARPSIFNGYANVPQNIIDENLQPSFLNTTCLLDNPYYEDMYRYLTTPRDRFIPNTSFIGEFREFLRRSFYEILKTHPIYREFEYIIMNYGLHKCPSTELMNFFNLPHKLFSQIEENGMVVFEETLTPSTYNSFCFRFYQYPFLQDYCVFKQSELLYPKLITPNICLSA